MLDLLAAAQPQQHKGLQEVTAIKYDGRSRVRIYAGGAEAHAYTIS